LWTPLEFEATSDFSSAASEPPCVAIACSVAGGSRFNVFHVRGSGRDPLAVGAISVYAATPGGMGGLPADAAPAIPHDAAHALTATMTSFDRTRRRC
jgi:hypothetical protein